jgi:PleD family two-component response regulator
MNYKYISKYQQFSNEDLKELENTIIKSHPKSIDNIIEVGTKAGFATLMLSSISKNVITLDEPAFWSPSVKDHLSLNNINNVKVRNDEDILTILEQEIGNKPEVIYIDYTPNEITPFLNIVKKFQKSDSNYKIVTIIYRTETGFESETIEATKRTPKKKPVAQESVSG